MPLNIKKLRIGSVVSVAGRMELVEAVDTGGINGDEGYTADDIDHLKVTPDMLSQFGFTVERAHSIIIGEGKIYHKHLCGMFLEAKPDGTFRLYGYDNCPITSVTQVQNILLDLFNFDLTIKL